MFQAQPGQEYSEIVLHVKFKENDATLQQETLGNLWGKLGFMELFICMTILED